MKRNETGFAFMWALSSPHPNAVEAREAYQLMVDQAVADIRSAMGGSSERRYVHLAYSASVLALNFMHLAANAGPNSGPQKISKVPNEVGVIEYKRTTAHVATKDHDPSSIYRAFKSLLHAALLKADYVDHKKKRGIYHDQFSNAISITILLPKLNLAAFASVEMKDAASERQWYAESEERAMAKNRGALAGEKARKEFTKRRNAERRKKDTADMVQLKLLDGAMPMDGVVMYDVESARRKDKSTKVVHTEHTQNTDASAFLRTKSVNIAIISATPSVRLDKEKADLGRTGARNLLTVATLMDRLKELGGRVNQKAHNELLEELHWMRRAMLVANAEFEQRTYALNRDKEAKARGIDVHCEAMFRDERLIDLEKNHFNGALMERADGTKVRLARIVFDDDYRHPIRWVFDKLRNLAERIDKLST